jgi:sugar phosphate isomerase/epimerase
VHAATNTNLIAFARDGSKTEMIHLIPRYAKAGFTMLDINLCELLNPNATLLSDRWREYVETLSSQRDAYHLTYHQAHAPYSKNDTTTHPLLSRAMEICTLLHIPILVVHPLPLSVSENILAYAPVIRQAEKVGLTLAFENLNKEGEITAIDDLAALVDGLDSPSAAICWDTGHAHMCGHDLVADIQKMGHRLKATHIVDNHGTEDEHLLPFFGTIEWERVIPALQESGYTGALTLECMFFTQHLRPALRDQVIRMAKACADELLAMLDGSDNAR